MVRQGMLPPSFACVQTGVWVSEPKIPEKASGASLFYNSSDGAKRLAPISGRPTVLTLPTNYNWDAFEELRYLNNELPLSLRH